MNTAFVADMVDQELGYLRALRFGRARVRALLAQLGHAREWSKVDRACWPMPATSDLYALSLIYRRLRGHGIGGAQADQLVRNDLTHRTSAPLVEGGAA